MKKRILALGIVLLFCLLLFAACGKEDDGIYTVTFSINGEKTKVEVARGEIPVCPAEKLSWETSEHFYKVTGWDKEIVPAERNATYVATVGEYGLTLYDVTFVIGGRETVTVKTHEGEIPTPPDGYETDLTKIAEIGAFTGWDKELVAPTPENTASGKRMTYVASYTYTTRYYVATFRIGGEEYKVETAAYETPACPVTPPATAKGSDGATLSFFGWDKKIAPATRNAIYTAWYGSEDAVSVLPAKDGAQAILTMTYDRSTTNPSESEWVLRMHDTYGIRGTNMLIVGRLNGTMVAEWEKNFARGTLDAGSLGMKHESARIETTQAIYRNEIVESKTLIEKLFPDQNAICFGSPYAQLRDFSYAENPDGTPDKTQKIYDGGSKKIARETYFAVRNGDKGLNTLDPGCTEDAGGWYNLKVQWTLNSQNSAQRLGWIDDAVKNKGWLLILAHSFSDSPSDETYTIPKTEAEAFFAHASGYVKTGELWSASFVEATKYLREKQGATVAKRNEGDSIVVGLKLDRTTSDGKYMDENVFNYPLSVEVRVPHSWTGATCTVNGKEETLAVYTKNGASAKYVTVNIVPGGDGAVSSVTVRKAQ